MTVVNGLTLPAAFVQLVSQAATPISWDLRENRDAYGNRWHADLYLHQHLEWIAHETRELPRRFKVAIRTPEEIEKGNEYSAHSPGFIPFITDFSRVVCFGRNAEGHAVCFDYRNTSLEPSIIFWDDCYWRRVAPSFDTLMSLFQPHEAKP
jgi:SMI1/KNR4 family protein SUKH-1